LSVGVDHIFDDGLGLLHMACISQNFAAVQCLVAARIDASYRDTQGQSPLFGSCDVQGRVWSRSTFAGMLSTALVVSKSVLDRPLTLLLQERSCKK